VLGPTGVGKSKLAVFLSQNLNGEVISADSVQVYRGFNIGSAKISKDEKKGIQHHLIDIISPLDQFNVNDFIELSFREISEITKRGKLPIVCGGTALYLRGMIKGIFKDSKRNRISRYQLLTIGNSKGFLYLWNRLAIIDSKYAEKKKKNDRKRIIRGLEIYYNNGVIPSNISSITKSPYENYKFIRIGLNIPRDVMYERINDRVDKMMGGGLVNEVKELRNLYGISCPPMRSIGYKEINTFLDDKMSLKLAVQLIKQHSRNFAKRQMTWFRGEDDINWFDPKEKHEILSFIKERILGNF